MCAMITMIGGDNGGGVGAYAQLKYSECEIRRKNYEEKKSEIIIERNDWWIKRMSVPCEVQPCWVRCDSAKRMVIRTADAIDSNDLDFVTADADDSSPSTICRPSWNYCDCPYCYPDRHVSVASSWRNVSAKSFFRIVFVFTFDRNTFTHLHSDADCDYAQFYNRVDFCRVTRTQSIQVVVYVRFEGCEYWLQHLHYFNPFHTK